LDEILPHRCTIKYDGTKRSVVPIHSMTWDRLFSYSTLKLFESRMKLRLTSEASRCFYVYVSFEVQKMMPKQLFCTRISLPLNHRNLFFTVNYHVKIVYFVGVSASCTYVRTFVWSWNICHVQKANYLGAGWRISQNQYHRLDANIRNVKTINIFKHIIKNIFISFFIWLIPMLRYVRSFI